VTETLRLTFDVSCSVEHAFRVWTDRIAAWWPRDHTVTEQPESVVLQARLGGRIYEVTPEGIEHDWGEVTAWEPPRRLAYLWHLGRPPELATEVEVTFSSTGERATRVEIAQAGWERFGADADAWRARNRIGWSTVMLHYVRFIDALDAVDGAGTTRPHPDGGN
jgi:uncharacterized protein YndB with AHSA1/START domain